MYEKTNWIDHIEDPISGEVLQEGTQIDSTKMNKIEQGIADAHALADTAADESKAYTDNRLTELIDAAPGALDTLKELADALGNDADFATTITNMLATKVDQTVHAEHVAENMKFKLFVENTLTMGGII